jgi:hypothetical protein
MLYHQELHCLHNQNSEMKNTAINITQQHGIFTRLNECFFSIPPEQTVNEGNYDNKTVSCKFDEAVRKLQHLQPHRQDLVNYTQQQNCCFPMPYT